MGIVKNTFSRLVTVATTFSLGVLSFCGMMLIYPSLPVAVISFFLAAAIEGAVYNENIFQALQRLGHQKSLLARAIIQRELKRLKKNGQYKDNIFLNDYFNQKDYLHELEENTQYYDKNAAKLEIEQVKKRLNRMEKIFIGCIRNKIKKSNDPQHITFSISQLIDGSLDKSKLDADIAKKNFYMNCSVIVSGGAGFCAGLISLASMHSSIFLVSGVSLGLSALAPLVGFAAVGYALMMYRTITDMIQNETLQKWSTNIVKFFKKHNKPWQDYLKIMGIIFVISIAVLATIATAGTWWYLAKAGASLANYLPKGGMGIAGIISWAFMLIPNLLFNTVNALKSVNKLPGIIHDFFHEIKKELVNTIKSENIVQLINPFRIIHKLFTAAVFVGHLISIAVTADRCPILTPAACAGVNTANEALVDLHYVTNDPHDHEHDTHQHGCDHADSHHHGHSHGHSEEDEHEHTHGDFILGKIELMFNYLSVSWDWFFSSGSWQQSKNKFIGHKELPNPQQLSTPWIQCEVNGLLKQQVNKYKSMGVSDKAIAFKTLKKSLEFKESKDNSANNTDYRNLLSTQLSNLGAAFTRHRNRHRLFSGVPESKKVLDKISSCKSFRL